METVFRVDAIVRLSLMVFLSGCTFNASIKSLESASLSLSTITMPETTVNEGQSLSLLVESTALADADLNLEYKVVAETALSGKEFGIENGVLTISKGQSSGTITIPILEDTIYESEKYFFVDVVFSHLKEIRRYKIIVKDNDSIPVINFQSASYNFPEANKTYGPVLVLSHASELPVDVSVSISGSAQSAIDYVSPTATVQFSPLQTSASINTQVLDDLVSESDETIVFTLSNPVTATIGTTNVATAQLLDNEIQVVASAPTYGANWMDFVQTNAGRFKIDDVDCGNLLNARSCTHAGEAKTVRVSDYSTCTGIKMEDTLGAFDWKCFVEAEVVYFRSRLKAGKGLKDLIDPTAWKNNKVQLIDSQSLSVLRESVSSQWWSNPVSVLPLNVGSAVYTLSTTGAIYTVSDARSSYGYNLSVPKIAIVHLTGGSMTQNAGTSNYCTAAKANVCLSGKHAWLEGNFIGNGSSTNISFATAYGRIHNSTIVGGLGAYTIRAQIFNSQFSGCNGYCIYSNGYDYYNKINVSGSSSYGIWDVGNDTLLYDSVIANNPVYGARLGYQSKAIKTISYNNGVIGIDANTGSIISSIAAGNASYGIRTTNSSRTLGITSILNATGGLSETDDYPTHQNLVLLNNGIGLDAPNSGDPKFYDIYAAFNTTGINLPANGSSTSRFYGDLYIGSNTDDCAVAAAGLGLDTNCDNNGQSTATKYGIVSANLIFGKSNGDLVNTHSASIGASGLFAFASITDWINFENSAKFFGIGGSAFPNADNRGRCTSGNCQLWDFSLPATSDLRNKYGTFSNGDPCPAKAYTSLSHASENYLASAFEIMFNEDGNEDGFCNANESCIFMPNLGGYQGFGDYTTIQCVYSGGTIPGVQLYRYPNN